MTPRQREIGADVLEACRRGDRDGFRALYDAYRDRVYSVALYFFHGDAATAGDVTQEIFIKLMGNLGGFRGDARFSTWLYRMVVNACLDRSRGRGAREVAADPLSFDRITVEGSQERDLVRQDAADAVRRAVAALPARLRLAILLRYFDDLSYEEIAAALGCSVGTIASRLSRGHRLLARTLAPLREGERS